MKKYYNIFLFILLYYTLISQEVENDSISFNVNVVYEINELNQPEAYLQIADSIDYIYEYIIGKWGKTHPDYFGVRQWYNCTLECFDDKFDVILIFGKLNKSGDFIKVKMKDEPPDFKKVNALRLKFTKGKYNLLNVSDNSKKVIDLFYKLLIETLPESDNSNE